MFDKAFKIDNLKNRFNQKFNEISLVFVTNILLVSTIFLGSLNLITNFPKNISNFEITAEAKQISDDEQNILEASKNPSNFDTGITNTGRAIKEPKNKLSTATDNDTVRDHKDSDDNRNHKDYTFKLKVNDEKNKEYEFLFDQDAKFVDGNGLHLALPKYTEYKKHYILPNISDLKNYINTGLFDYTIQKQWDDALYSSQYPEKYTVLTKRASDTLGFLGYFRDEYFSSDKNHLDFIGPSTFNEYEDLVPGKIIDIVRVSGAVEDDRSRFSLNNIQVEAKDGYGVMLVNNNQIGIAVDTYFGLANSIYPYTANEEYICDYIPDAPLDPKCIVYLSNQDLTFQGFERTESYSDDVISFNNIFRAYSYKNPVYSFGFEHLIKAGYQSPISTAPDYSKAWASLEDVSMFDINNPENLRKEQFVILFELSDEDSNDEQDQDEQDDEDSNDGQDQDEQDEQDDEDSNDEQDQDGQDEQDDEDSNDEQEQDEQDDEDSNDGQDQDEQDDEIITPITYPGVPCPVYLPTISQSDYYLHQLSLQNQTLIIPEFNDNQLINIVKEGGKKVHKIETNKYIACFGYNNNNSQVVSIPAGADNRFNWGGYNWGQTTIFLPGRHQNQFGVELSCNQTLVWTFKSPDGRIRTATASTPTCE